MTKGILVTKTLQWNNQLIFVIFNTTVLVWWVKLGWNGQPMFNSCLCVRPWFATSQNFSCIFGNSLALMHGLCTVQAIRCCLVLCVCMSLSSPAVPPLHSPVSIVAQMKAIRLNVSAQGAARSLKMLMSPIGALMQDPGTQNSQPRLQKVCVILCLGPEQGDTQLRALTVTINHVRDASLGSNLSCFN